MPRLTWIKIFLHGLQKEGIPKPFVTWLKTWMANVCLDVCYMHIPVKPIHYIWYGSPPHPPLPPPHWNLSTFCSSPKKWHSKLSSRREGIFAAYVIIKWFWSIFHFRVLETTSNAASSVHSKKSKIKHQAEAEKQKAEAEAKAAKDREEVGPNCSLFVTQSVLHRLGKIQYVKYWVINIVWQTLCDKRCVINIWREVCVTRIVGSGLGSRLITLNVMSWSAAGKTTIQRYQQWRSSDLWIRRLGDKLWLK